MMIRTKLEIIFPDMLLGDRVFFVFIKPPGLKAPPAQSPHPPPGFSARQGSPPRNRQIPTKFRDYDMN